MKIRMLVGACGLALAGTSFGAVKGVDTTTRIIQAKPNGATMHKALPESDMAEWRANRSEASSPFGRSLLSGAARGSGFVYQDTYDGMDADQMRPQDAPGQYIRQTDLTEPSTYEGDFSLVNQREPDGALWGATQPWVGVVDNLVAQSDNDMDPSNGEYNGPAGGPDPMGVRGGMINVQRASVNAAPVDSGFITNHTNNTHNLYTGTPSDPLFIQMDFYKNSHEEYGTFRPISFTEGLFHMVSFWGGDDGDGGNPFYSRFGAPDLLEGIVTVANNPDDLQAGPFVTTSHEIPEGGWFTIGMLTDAASFQAIFIRDNTTTADVAPADGVPDFVMPQNTMTGMRMFEEFGLGLETGWVQIQPGTEDDPMTTEIEGVGQARDFDDQPLPDPFTQNGNAVTSIWASISVDAWRLWVGDDDTADPNYEIKDYWYDNHRVSGVPFEQPDPIPTYRIPYVDDLERWNLGRMSLQGGRWFEGTSARTTVSDSRNNTSGTGSDGAPPEQSLLFQSRIQDDLWREEFETNLPTNPRVRGQVGDPAITRAAMRNPSNALTMSVNAEDGSQAQSDTVEYIARLFTSGTDSNLIGDGQVYVRQRKPLGTDVANGEFDVTQPVVPTNGPHLTPDQEESINTEFINIPANPAGQGSFSLPTNSFFAVEFRAEPGSGMPAPNGEEHVVEVFVDTNGSAAGGQVQLHPNGDDTQVWTTKALTADDLEFGSGNNFFAGFQNVYVDDIFFDGPTQTDTIVGDNGMLADAEFADDSPWSLPFADSLDTYEKERPAVPQGFTELRVGFLPIGDPDLSPVPNDFDEIEFVQATQNLVDGDTEVVAYEVTDITLGAGVVGFNIGDIVAINREIVFPEFDSDDEIFGVINDGMQDPTEWYILDSINGSEIARGEWYLAVDNSGMPGVPNGVTTYDAMTMVDFGARYSYRTNFRHTGAASEAEFVDANVEGIDPGATRGDVAKLLVSANSNSESENQTLRQNTVGMFSTLMPAAQPTSADGEAILRYDVYVGQNRFETGFYTTFPGSGPTGGEITALGFGGKGFISGNPVDGVTQFLPNNGNFFFRKANPLGGGGNPEFIWEDTGVPVPTETWMTIEATVNGNSEWTISLNGSQIANGVAGDVGDPALNTNSFQTVNFIRNQFGDNDGAPTSGPVIWTARAFDAVAPVAGDVPDEYHAYFINTILDDTDVPLIQPVDSTTGDLIEDMMGMPTQRPLGTGDNIVLINENPATMMPYDQQFTNFRWELQDGMGAVRATGTWTVLGLPGSAGVTSEAPEGGITASGPPYNAGPPFETILLGDYVEVVDTQVLEADRWYVDQIELELNDVEPCPQDLVGGDRIVGAADLAALIAAWGQTGVPADFDGGGVGASDLASLIAAWGPCD